MADNKYIVVTKVRGELGSVILSDLREVNREIEDEWDADRVKIFSVNRQGEIKEIKPRIDERQEPSTVTVSKLVVEKEPV